MRSVILSIYLLSLSIVAKTQSTAAPAFLNLLIDYPNVRDFTVSNDGKEAYFSAQSPLENASVIMMITSIDGRWTTPEIASFSGRYHDLEPFLSSDGLQMYFASNRPLNQASNEIKDYDIWLSERESKNSSWAKPVNLGPPVNTEHNEFYPSISSNNNLYFTSDTPGSKGKDDIFFATSKNGSYSTPISLNDSINSDGYEFNAYIAPDESYLIFSGYNREDGFGSGDLYISYKNKDNSWSKARNLGADVNSKYLDYCPYISTATKKLYFTSNRSNIVNPENGFKSSEEFLKEVTKYQNGLSRIYVVDFDKFIHPGK